MIESPVLFLVFNRPQKTQLVFDVIKKAQPQKLYIAADGPREHVESDIKNCSLVRKIVSQIDWKCDAKFLFHEKNLGCSLAGKTAWDWIFDHEEEMIFIEDDGLISLSFFSFAQELLEKYRNNPKIAYINSQNFDIQFGLPASYFYSRFGCGTIAMATWKRVYELYEYKLESYNQTINSGYRKTFLNKFDYDYTNSKFINYLKQGGNTYDLQMIYLIHKYDMYNIIPNINMCTGLGFDIDATNTIVKPNSAVARKFGNRPRFELSEIIHPDTITIDKKFEMDYFKARVLYGKPWILAQLKFYLKPYLGPIYGLLFKKPFMLLKKVCHA